NARASGTYAGKPSAIGSPALKAIRSDLVPTRTRGVARPETGHTALTRPPPTSTSQTPMAAPSDRRRSVRRETPVVGRSRRAVIARTAIGSRSSGRASGPPALIAAPHAAVTAGARRNAIDPRAIQASPNGIVI